MSAVHESVLEAIGGTPLFRLARLGAALPAPVYAKAEFLSIGGSVKDRAALAMVERAERDYITTFEANLKLYNETNERDG